MQNVITISWKSVQCSFLCLPYPVSDNTLLAMYWHYADVSRDTMTTLNCVTPPRVHESMMIQASCIVHVSTYLHHLQSCVATMSWSFRTFVNKGNVRIIITQMLEWKQSFTWIHAHVSRFLFIVLWIIKRLTPPKYQSHYSIAQKKKSGILEFSKLPDLFLYAPVSTCIVWRVACKYSSHVSQQNVM